MDEIDRQCNEALGVLREIVRGMPYESNIICQALVELAAEHELQTDLDLLYGRVDSAIMKIEGGCNE